MMKQAKSTVTLRFRKVKDGRQSIYLDIYHEGKRKYENLNIYLESEESPGNKRTNKANLLKAQAIAATRLDELQNGEFNMMGRGDKSLIAQWLDAHIHHIFHGGSLKAWHSTRRHLENYDKKFHKRKICEITADWIRGFLEYLKTTTTFTRQRQTNKPLETSSIANHYSLLRRIITVLQSSKLLPPSLLDEITTPIRYDSERNFLNIDELRRLSETECAYDIVKRAFLFSCLTGLRFSDIKSLKWSQVQRNGDFTRIVFKQQKTKRVVYHDLNPQAIEYMGKHGASDDHVFDNLVSSPTISRTIERWVKKAGINKKITFHCARHTFATLLLDQGTDLYTVSKLLGHSSITVTQIYAHLVDKKRQEAVLKLPSLSTTNPI